jgi:hypothetical protein
MNLSRAKCYEHADDRPGTCPHCQAAVVIPGIPEPFDAIPGLRRSVCLAITCWQCAKRIWLIDSSDPAVAAWVERSERHWNEGA